MKLNQRRKHKKRYRVEAPQPLLQPVRPTQAWSMDFMNDALRSGRAFRTLNILDDYHREILRIEIDVSLTAKRMVRVLEQQAAAYVKPPMTVAEVLARLAELAPTLPARYREHRR
jgi:putative transposase